MYSCTNSNWLCKLENQNISYTVLQSQQHGYIHRTFQGREKGYGKEKKVKGAN